MTDRINSFTVALAEDIKEDDATAIGKALSMVKGVLSVKSGVVDEMDYLAYQRARHDLSERLWAALQC